MAKLGVYPEALKSPEMIGLLDREIHRARKALERGASSGKVKQLVIAGKATCPEGAALLRKSNQKGRA